MMMNCINEEYKRSCGQPIKKAIASVSWGKDSLCMLLTLIEKGYPLDEAVFFDTGMEFQAIYDTRDKVLPLLKEHGIKYTELHPEKSFEYLMFEKPVKKRGTDIVHKHGYSWCGGACRWGTTEKTKMLDKHCGDNTTYIGIAHDEWERIGKKRAKNKKFPLVEWGISEGEALVYCYKHGYYWEEDGKPLYGLLDRVSCWCCTNNNLKELRNMWAYLPKYWDKLKEFQARTDRPYKGKGQSIDELEARFIIEQRGEKWEKAEEKQ